MIRVCALPEASYAKLMYEQDKLEHLVHLLDNPNVERVLKVSGHFSPLAKTSSAKVGRRAACRVACDEGDCLATTD